MKITVLYGFLTAAAGLLLNVIYTFAGVYADAQKLAGSQVLINVLGLVIPIVGLWLGIRAVRASVPATEAFGYGRGVGAGALTTLWNAIFSVIFTIVFFTLINPDAHETLIRMQLDKVAEKGGDPEKVEGMTRTMMSLPFMSVWLVVGIGILGMIITLILAAFLRREPARVPPAAPPVTA